jgi:signal transduction histidine kinase
LPSLQFYINKHFNDDIKITGITNLFFELKLMISKRHETLLSPINKIINSINNDEKNTIYRKWVVESKEGIDPSLFYKLLILVTIAFVLGALWNYQLLRSKKLLEKEKSKLKKVENEIKELNNTLEERIIKEVNRNKEQQLLMIHQSRHAQMGEMISMIAHQWRQPLNILSLISQSILFKYESNKLDDKMIKELINKGDKQINAMSKTIDDFRNFFKPNKSKVEFIVNDILNQVIDILNPLLLDNNIKTTIKFQENIKIIGYPNEFAQALINIITNSKDALVENNISNKRIIITLKQLNKETIIEILDNAGGIDNNIISNIFQPYFSTKLEKNGTGLGLYMSKLIIEDEMKGRIKVINKKGGTNVSLTFKK